MAKQEHRLGTQATAELSDSPAMLHYVKSGATVRSRLAFAVPSGAAVAEVGLRSTNGHEWTVKVS
ncbi:hypothetical protein [Haloechinothrix alba]|uniref:hypothetical protein n=1 Tax=Haloechinothrix alba TaxID=664784 RepID=UPI0011321E5E|nr:hypothetical protein [Haloechinothrix alba]